jgi:hypothetical protein
MNTQRIVLFARFIDLNKDNFTDKHPLIRQDAEEVLSALHDALIDNNEIELPAERLEVLGE